MTARRNSEAYAEIEDIFDLLDRNVTTKIGGALGKKMPLSGFAGARLLDGDALHGFGRADDILVDQDIFDLWPVHSRVLVFQGGGYNLGRIDSVGVREVRGRVRCVRPRMLRLRTVAAEGCSAVGIEAYYAVRPNGLLEPIGSMQMPRSFDQWAMDVMRCTAGLALTMEYEWSVTIGKIGSSFNFNVGTDARGARKLLAFRDLPEGKQRRAALRHWVGDHYRRRPNQSALEAPVVPVSEHLRGVTRFTWDDFEGFVSPSPYDLRRAEQAAAR